MGLTDTGDASPLAKLRRLPFALWLAILVGLAGWQCTLWQLGADDVAFFRNYTISDASGLRTNVARIVDDFTGPWFGNATNPYWRPLVSLSLGVDFALFGAAPGISCAINLLLHFLSAVLVWRIGRAVLPGTRAAALAALLFATTPLAHENLAWLVGRCMLTNVFGLAATLAYLAADSAGRRGFFRFAPSLALAACNLGCMESALIWLSFPPLCVAMRSGFRQHYSGLVRDFVRDALPFAALGVAYLGLRILLLGGITGEHGAGLDGGVAAITGELWRAFVHTLCPIDASYMPEGAGTSVMRALCFAPLVVGLAAPLHFGDARSRGYRRALAILLGFWVLARLPGLTHLSMDAELAGSRTSYYAYAPLALAYGMLASTVRYARWATMLLALVFAMGLSHRLGERAAWADAGLRAREAVIAEAKKRGAIGDEQNAPTIAFLNLCDGRESAPAVHVGEMPLMLSPPWCEARVRAVSIYHFAPRGEAWVAAWFAHELGGAFTISEPKNPRDALEVRSIDSSSLLNLDLPILEGPKLRFARAIPQLELPAWATPQNAVVALSAGRHQIVRPVDPEGTLGWPADALAALQEWLQQGGRGAPIAVALERRTSPSDPKSTSGRSRLLVSRLGH